MSHTEGSQLGLYLRSLKKEDRAKFDAMMKVDGPAIHDIVEGAEVDDGRRRVPAVRLPERGVRIPRAVRPGEHAIVKHLGKRERNLMICGFKNVW